MCNMYAIYPWSMQVTMRRRGFLSKVVIFLVCTCFVTGVLVTGYGSPPADGNNNIALPHRDSGMVVGS